METDIKDTTDSIPEPKAPRRTGRLRRLWPVLAIPLALGGVSYSAAQAGGFGAGADGGGEHGGRGGGRHGGRHMAKRLDRMLDAATASDAQRVQIKAIWANLQPQLQTARQEGGKVRRQIGEAMAAPTIDAARIEQLRKQSVQGMDRVSALVTQGMLSSAQVLTPEQRQKVLAEMQKHRFHPDHDGE